jgi:hypothetical protein
MSLKSQDRIDVKDAVARECRREYRAPRVVRYGSVRELTMTGSGIHPENTGMDDDNNMRRFP